MVKKLMVGGGNEIIIIVVIILLLGGAGYYFYNKADIDCNSDGSKNTNRCNCGNSVCSENQYCYDNKCSDTSKPCKGDCGDNGTCENGTCKCKNNYSGDLCQVEPNKVISGDFTLQKEDQGIFKDVNFNESEENIKSQIKKILSNELNVPENKIKLDNFKLS